MSPLPESVYSVSSVRELDRIAIEDAGIPGYTLMTRAGAAAVAAIRERYPELQRWQVVCGAGNNAGDGYVVARLAAREGIAVSVVALVEPDALKGDAALAFNEFAAESGSLMPWSGELDADADVVVDAMLGSGLQRDVGGDFAAAVDAVNAHGGAIIALDLPTGLHGDSGAILGSAVRADLTITFVGLKTGLLIESGPEQCGEIVYAGLDIAEEWRAQCAVDFRRKDRGQLHVVLPRRRRSAHKGEFGHVLVVGGAAGMPGAIRLCAEAALRGGAGRVSVATDRGHAAIIVATRPELMSHGIRDVSDLEPLLEQTSVVAFGPGLGRSPWAADLFTRLSVDDKPCVWDADALNWLAETPAKAENRIITPHPGEAARLLGITTAAVQSDRRAACAALYEKFDGVVVLKGAGSLTYSGTGAPWLCTSGNPGMAGAGMGDALTGIIAALLAQGLSPDEAAAFGVEVHAAAGDRAASAGERGMLAQDLCAEIRRVINA